MSLQDIDEIKTSDTSVGGLVQGWHSKSYDYCTSSPRTKRTLTFHIHSSTILLFPVPYNSTCLLSAFLQHPPTRWATSRGAPAFPTVPAQSALFPPFLAAKGRRGRYVSVSRGARGKSTTATTSNAASDDSQPLPRHNTIQALKNGLASAALIATMLIAPVQQASAASVGCAKCDENNAASLLVELQEQELPALQANVSKIRDPKIGSAVESKLSSIETEVAMLAESYDQGKMPASGLARSANRVISEIATLKGEMRANE